MTKKHPYIACARDNLYLGAPVVFVCPTCGRKKAVDDPAQIARVQKGAVAFCGGKRIKVESHGGQMYRQFNPCSPRGVAYKSGQQTGIAVPLDKK